MTHTLPEFLDTELATKNALQNQPCVQKIVQERSGCSSRSQQRQLQVTRTQKLSCQSDVTIGRPRKIRRQNFLIMCGTMCGMLTGMKETPRWGEQMMYISWKTDLAVQEQHSRFSLADQICLSHKRHIHECQETYIFIIPSNSCFFFQSNNPLGTLGLNGACVPNSH